MQNVSRRDFLKGLGIGSVSVAAAGALAGCGGASTGSGAKSTDHRYAKKVSDVSSLERIETDVLVIGGGGAGICAALSAAEQGAGVIICEKGGVLGGATALSSGKIPAVGTRQQVEMGEPDSIGACAMDIFRPNNYSVRPDLVYTVVEQSRSIIEWTEERGAVWSIDAALYYGQTAHRMHTTEGAGSGLTKALISYMGGESGITQMLTCEMKGLIIGDDDSVVGAYGTDADKRDIAIMANNTVLATSGFGNNPEMIAQYCPEVVDSFKMVAPGATGEGIRWAEELGAELQNMGAYQGHAFHDVDDDTTVEQALANNGGIIVNLEGNRFMSEYGGYSELAPHILAQTDHIAFLCFTDIQVAKSKKFPDWQKAGIVYTGKTVDEFAGAIGVDAKTLGKTIAEYQAGIAAGQDKFNRCHLPENFDGPYYALKITGEIRHTQGGMVTDVAGHVLRTDKSLIKGLYAAGGCIEGFSSRGGAAYMSGNGLIQALVFGRIAGAAAATESKDTAKLVEWTKSSIDAYI